jgi:hypothetical protein
MENFISDTEINIKHKMMCRICFLYRFGGGGLCFGGAIHFFGNGGWRFRPSGEPFGKT